MRNWSISNCVGRRRAGVRTLGVRQAGRQGAGGPRAGRRAVRHAADASPRCSWQDCGPRTSSLRQGFGGRSGTAELRFAGKFNAPTADHLRAQSINSLGTRSPVQMTMLERSGKNGMAGCCAVPGAVAAAAGAAAAAITIPAPSAIVRAARRSRAGAVRSCAFGAMRQRSLPQELAVQGSGASRCALTLLLLHFELGSQFVMRAGGGGGCTGGGGSMGGSGTRQRALSSAAWNSCLLSRPEQTRSITPGNVKIQTCATAKGRCWRPAPLRPTSCSTAPALPGHLCGRQGSPTPEAGWCLR